jgi:peptidyl-prolyl cis-trans isomerase SurA
VKDFYRSIPQDSLPYFSTEVSVSQVVLHAKPGKKQEEAVRKQLLDLRQRIIEGESFGTLARAYSEDPGSAANGGELPYYKRGELAPEFEATAMTIKEGEISMPVRSKFGYHIIELLDRRGNTFKSRHILIIPKPDGNDVIRAQKKLDSIRNMILLDSITFRNAAKEFSDDEMTSSNGGAFSDEEGNTRVSVETLDPNIFFTIDTMQIGSISKPIRFLTPDGTPAYRILYYQNKVAPHQANLRDDYQKIATAALNEKKARILGKWFDGARGEVYIEVVPEFNYCNLIE